MALSASLTWNPHYLPGVVPASHRRPNTDSENEQLVRDARVPLDTGMQVKLKAGQGVLYTNTILHWGSVSSLTPPDPLPPFRHCGWTQNYSAKLRRCVHFGYRSLRGRSFPYVACKRKDATESRI